MSESKGEKVQDTFGEMVCRAFQILFRILDFILGTQESL